VIIREYFCCVRPVQYVTSVVIIGGNSQFNHFLKRYPEKEYACEINEVEACIREDSRTRAWRLALNNAAEPEFVGKVSRNGSMSRRLLSCAE